MEYLIIIFSLIAIASIGCLVKYTFTKFQCLKNSKDPIIVYASWAVIWLWVLNYWFYDIYLYSLQYGMYGSVSLKGVYIFILFGVPFVAIVYLIVMFAVAKMLKKQLTSHIVVGFLLFIFSAALPDHITGFAKSVALWEWVPKWVVTFFNTIYNVFFLLYIIGFLIYGIIQIKQKSDKQH